MVDVCWYGVVVYGLCVNVSLVYVMCENVGMEVCLGLGVVCYFGVELVEKLVVE